MGEQGRVRTGTRGRFRRWHAVAAVAALAGSTLVLVGQAEAGEAPATVVATAGNAQVTVTFTEPDTAPGQANGVTTGYTLQNYQVKVYSADSATVLGTQTCTNGGTANESCVITSYLATADSSTVNLTNGTQYSFGVIARWERNADQVIVPGTESARSEVVTPFTTPSTPDKPTVAINATTPTSVDVSWAAATANGNAIDLYTVQIWNKAGSSTVSVNGSTTGCTTSTLTCTVPGLTNGTAYTFKVKANNDAGDSEYSVVSNSITIAPGVPTNVAATIVRSGSDTTVKVTWDEPATNVETITEYTVTATPTSGTAVTKTWSSGTREAIYTAGEASEALNLTLGTAYAVTVKAKNTTYGSDTSSVSVTPTEAPGTPAAPTSTPASTTVDLSWSAPTALGGSTINAYTAGVWAGDAADTNTAPLFTCTTTGATSCTVTGLTASTQYKAAVKASNAAVGYGSWGTLTTNAFQTSAAAVTTTTTTTTTLAPTTTVAATTTTAAPPIVTTTQAPAPTTSTTTATTVPAPTTTVPALSGTPVVIPRAPAASVAQNVALAVAKTKVQMALTVPKAASTSSQITKYMITLKPTKGATITRTIVVKPGATVKPVITGKSSTTYSVTITAQTKSGKKTSWKGPNVKTGK